MRSSTPKDFLIINKPRDLKCELDAGHCKGLGGATGTEDSYQKQYEPYRNIFKNTPVTMTSDQYNALMPQVDKESLTIADRVYKEKAASKPNISYSLNNASQQPITLNEAKTILDKLKENKYDSEAELIDAFQKESKLSRIKAMNLFNEIKKAEAAPTAGKRPSNR